MRTKNARTIDADESAYIADVKRCDCVICGAGKPSEAHHPEQGQHFNVIACCKPCHGGPGYPHGWHGDKSRWRTAKMTELRAINETRRAVERLRAGKPSTPAPRRSQSNPKPNAGSALSSSKILPRREAA